MLSSEEPLIGLRGPRCPQRTPFQQPIMIKSGSTGDQATLEMTSEGVAS